MHDVDMVNLVSGYVTAPQTFWVFQKVVFSTRTSAYPWCIVHLYIRLLMPSLGLKPNTFKTPTGSVDCLVNGGRFLMIVIT